MVYDIWCEAGKWYFLDEFDIITYGPFNTKEEAKNFYDEYYNVIFKWATSLIQGAKQKS